ncbi:MAG: 30S ribosomal protein S6 [Epulopiscium sp. Nele67-Bin005]|nr:MAG: 30S ribosomal protein S6 [Epulopiscium sp. Nele67-Bin005]
MKNYELALVLVASLGEEEKLAQLEKVKELIVRFGGEITNVDDWGKRKLAYEIKKIDKHREGFYYFIHFNAEPSTPAEVESRLRITESVLRYLIVRLDEK